MAASKRFRIPTLDEMEHVSTEEAPQPLFKRRKEFNQENSHASTPIENSKTDRNITKPAAESKPTTKNASVKSTVPVNSNHSSHASTSSTRLDLHPQQNLKDGHIHKETDMSSGSSSNKLASNMLDSAGTGSNSEISNGVDDTSKGPPTASKPGSSNSLIVNTRQRGNPILKSVRNIPWEYGNIVPDYVMGQSNCALFLSLRYHQLHPNYIHERLKLLGKSYDLRVMLVQVDVKEPHHLLKDLAKICLLADCTLVLAFSPEEAGRYLETYKIFENKPPEAIMEKTEENFMAKFTDCLTRVKSVNKTDCATLISHFGSLANIMEASEEDLSLCPGFGPQKAKRLHDIFHEPFLRSATKGSSSKVNEISS